jgi:hypothetical protein
MVASTGTAGTVGPVVKQPHQTSKDHPAPAPTKAVRSQTMFWRRYRNPELDRSGDWILANLAAIRGKAPFTDVPPR